MSCPTFQYYKKTPSPVFNKKWFLQEPVVKCNLFEFKITLIDTVYKPNYKYSPNVGNLC